MPNSFYRLVDIHIHGDEKVRALTPEPPSGRGLFKHLLICPELGPLPGVIRTGAAALAEALEWPLESFHACFVELLREGLVQVDWKAGLIFLANGIRYTPPNNASQVTGWLRHWNALPDSPLNERHAAWCAAWASGASLPMNLANWINKRRGWREQPPEARPHTAGSCGSTGTESFAELADRHEESLRTLDWEATA